MVVYHGTIILPNIKYILYTKKFGIIVKPKVNLESFQNFLERKLQQEEQYIQFIQYQFLAKMNLKFQIINQLQVLEEVQHGNGYVILKMYVILD